MSLERRWEQLRSKVCEKEFLNNKGLGNEVPYWIFDYDPKQELIVRESVPTLLSYLKNMGITAIEYNLFDAILNVLENKGYLDKAYELEKNHSSARLLQALSGAIPMQDICQDLSRKIEEAGAQIGVITGVGSAWPVLRIHSFLNVLQPIKSDVPIVVIYPGKYEHNELRLFNVFSSHYYRAFQIVGD